MKIKTSVNKDYTTLARLAQVKTDLKDFAASYTGGDLLNAFQNATGLYDSYGDTVIAANVEAFPGGSDFGDETHFCVELTTYGYDKFCTIRFYCDKLLTVNVREIPYYGHPDREPMKLYEQRVYKPV